MIPLMSDTVEKLRELELYDRRRCATSARAQVAPIAEHIATGRCKDQLTPFLRASVLS